MRTIYGRGEREYRIARTSRRPGGRRQRCGLTLGRKEKCRLIQLLVCILIFTVAFVGKGVFPERVGDLENSALTVLRSDTDFKAVFVWLGRAVSDGEPALETLGNLWTEITGGGTEPAGEQKTAGDSPAYRQERVLMTEHLSGKELIETRLGIRKQTVPAGADTAAGLEEQTDTSQPGLLEPEPQPVYTGAPLPENCTMEKVALGLEKTMTPVLGVISSGFGYRDNPIDGKNEFHYGIDIVADTGTPVAAFADGVVDYIGESEEYGQYIKLRHADGVTTFYAHCSKLCARKDQHVSMGDVIAEVGETGKATGPHLHLKVKRNGMFLNPIYYIDTL